jgi:hypothetical protein
MYIKKFLCDGIRNNTPVPRSIFWKNLGIELCKESKICKNVTKLHSLVLFVHHIINIMHFFLLNLLYPVYLNIQIFVPHQKSIFKILYVALLPLFS